MENDLEKVSGSLSIAYGETGDRRAKGTTRLRGGVFVVIPEISLGDKSCIRTKVRITKSEISMLT